MNNKISNVNPPAGGQMSNLVLILVFLIWRAFDSWILYLSSKMIPYLGFFPYKQQLFDFGLAQTLSALGNFDGIHYLLIAHRGNYGQYEQAFFPLYPLLIRILNPIFNNELITGLLISNISFLIGLFVFFKLLKSEAQNPKSETNSKFLVLIFLLAFPTSFYFGAVYTEGLFFLLFALTLYFLRKEKYGFTVLFVVLTSLTRLIGVFLFIPIIFHLIQKSNVKSQNLKSNIKSFFHLTPIPYHLTVLAPFIGLGIYCFYLWKTTGDPFFFLTSQPVFGANRSTNIVLLPQVIWRYLKILFTASHNFQYYISLFEFVIFNLVFSVVILNLFQDLKKMLKRVQHDSYDRIGLGLFSLANILLPTLTGTLSSIPRYALFSISFFLYISEIKNKWVKIIIAVIFTVFHVLSLGFFGQGYFIS